MRGYGAVGLQCLRIAGLLVAGLRDSRVVGLQGCGAYQLRCLEAVELWRCRTAELRGLAGAGPWDTRAAELQ